MALLRFKIPDKTRERLEWAFGKAFAMVFTHGEGIIKKTYSSEKLSRKYIARDLAMALDGDAEYFDSSGKVRSAGNMLITTLEGVGLGALGIGLPDIVLFVAMLLRGVYETALQYGYSCHRQEDKFYILNMLECAMLSGQAWVEKDAEVERLAQCTPVPSREAFDEQLQRAAAAFTTDLLVLKFVQGLPIVGLVGGLGNPVYYHKVLGYAELKYQRRYIKDAMEREKDIEE